MSTVGVFTQLDNLLPAVSFITNKKSALRVKLLMNGRIDGQTDRTDGRTDKQMVGQKDRQTERQTDGQKDRQTDKRKDRQTDGRANRQTD